MTRKKRKRTSGSSLLAGFAAALLLLMPSAGAKSKPRQPEPTAVIAGTVFRVPGFAVTGAELSIAPAAAEKDGVKFKKQKVVTNYRGEWAARVPVVPMSYTIHVQLNGYEPQQKTVSIEGEVRQEVNFLLEPAARPSVKEEQP